MSVAAQLRAVLAVLRDEIKPELNSAQTKFRAELMDMVLSRLVAEAEGADAGETFWGQIGLSDRRALTEVLPRMAESQAIPIIKHIAAAERARRVRLEGLVAENLRSLPPAAGSAGEAVLQPDEVTAYLRARFPGDPGITARRVSTVPGGRSKVTILLALETAAGPREIVIRKDFELGSAGISVSEEYPVIRAAWEAGLPVPEPLWLEETPSAIGSRFIAFAKVPGKSMGTLFQSEASPAFALEFARTLARLHNIDLDAGGLVKKLRWACDPHPVQELLDYFYARYRAMPPNALMDAAFAWLRLQLPDIGNTRALVHGDAGLHNVMGEGETLTALLDWEFSHAGDPAEDLTYCKYLIERILPWEAFMAVYVAAGGKPVSPARMRFFTVWRTLHLAIHTGSAKQDFDSGKDQDLRKAAIGYNTFPKQLRDLAEDLEKVAVEESGAF